MPRKLIAVKGLSREDWLAIRRKSIGGSDVAGILGLSPWSSPFAVWADKTGRLPEKEDNEAMRQGRDLEDYVAQRWCEATGKKVRRAAYMYQHDTVDYMTVNLDREVVGEKAFLECKTTSVMNLKKFKNGEFPEHYYAQCVHGLAVTGYERAYLGVLVLNQGFYHYVIERDEAEIEALMSAERELWQYVTNDTPPPIDGGEATTEALETIYADTVPRDEIDLFGMDNDLAEISEYKANIKVLQEAVAERENKIKATLGEAEAGRCGKHRVTWRKQTRTTFDHKKLSEDYPALSIGEYFKTNSFRVFKITEVEK